MGRMEVEIEAQSPADKLWEGLKDAANLFPKISPDRYASGEILEGDGKTAGSVLLMKYVQGASGITFSKERIDEVDEANKSMAYSIIEGELLTLYKTIKCSVQFLPKGDGSLVKWSFGYEKTSEEVPEPTLVKEFGTKTFKGLDAYYTQKA